MDYYRSHGVEYAWEDIVVGGEGLNPSLDVIKNGTFCGGSLFTNRDGQMRLIDGLKELGYVGIEYDGGKRLGANLRGGGGIRHRAFVFWDCAALNGMRIDVTPTFGQKPNADLTKTVRAASVYSY